MFLNINGTQATTTAQHTVRLDYYEDNVYDGALLYVTLSVNNFAYQSIEEIDPVDWWALIGSAGGVWGKYGCHATNRSSFLHVLNSISSALDRIRLVPVPVPVFHITSHQVLINQGEGICSFPYIQGCVRDVLTPRVY